MISIIITTYREPVTLRQALRAMLDNNLNEEYEILVVGPDRETEQIVNVFRESGRINYLKDDGRGKPAALNLALRQVRGEVLILTDGDVTAGQGSLKYLLESFKNKVVGAVSGRPISINPRETIFGYWSHFLTQAAHQMRLHNQSFPCSGYLYAIRNVIKEIPENVFSEDAVITQMIRDKGYRVTYAPKAEVYVKYPDNFRDWLKQKIRSTGGYVQKINNKVIKTRSFWQEMRDGIKLFFTFPQNLKEFLWTILLYLARLYLWFLIFWQIKIKKKKFKEIWQRIESTK